MTIKYIDRKTGLEKVETPPGEGFLKFLYHQPLGELALQLVVKRKLLSAVYGRLMDSSSSKKKIAPFVKQLDIDMSEAVRPIEEFKSFNDFFYRKLKPTARPIETGFISPGDGKLLAFENVNEANEFFVKGNKFTLDAYLQDKDLIAQFRNSSFIILRLAPNDYHRFHFPYSGQTSESHLINGNYLSVSPYALTKQFTRVFCENKRSFTILKTEDKGNVLISPVGATMVGSILETYKPNSFVNKGDEMGYFAFGGSTIVLFVNKDKIKIDADLLQNTKNKMETYVRMGEKIGV